MLNNLYDVLNFIGLSAPVENVMRFDRLATVGFFEQFVGVAPSVNTPFWGPCGTFGYLEPTVFFFFAIASIISGFLVIISVNPMHSVFALVLTFVNASILLLFLGIEFLAFLFMIVYVGAIAILFLFVVMMLNIRIVELVENTTRYVPIGLIVGLVFLIELSLIFSQTRETIGVSFESLEAQNFANFLQNDALRPEDAVRPQDVENSIGVLSASGYPLRPREMWDLAPATSWSLLEAGQGLNQSGTIGSDASFFYIKNATSTFFNSTNLRSLGNVLYTEYFVYFLVSSLVLLIAMIGAILLTLHHEKGVKRQDIYSQIATSLDFEDASHIRLRRLIPSGAPFRGV